MSVEVLGLTAQGMRLFVQGEVLFLSYEQFPGFVVLLWRRSSMFSHWGPKASLGPIWT